MSYWNGAPPGPFSQSADVAALAGALPAGLTPPSHQGAPSAPQTGSLGGAAQRPPEGPLAS